MVELLKRQESLWQLIQNISGQKAMLRLSREDDCIWVCDLPRRLLHHERTLAESHLREAGFLVRFDETTSLWQIDLPLNDSLFAAEGNQPLPLPRKEILYPVYALYRMLAAHPCPAEQQPITLLRGLLKCTACSPEENKPKLAQLTSQCTACLNRKQPLPAAACHALQQYICQEDAK